MEHIHKLSLSSHAYNAGKINMQNKTWDAENACIHFHN